VSTDKLQSLDTKLNLFPPRCCLRFGGPANEFIFDAIVDRMWEVAQGRFGARSMRACLESTSITINQQRRVATAVILNSIPLATNPNGALLLTWLLDTSNFPSRYNLLAPRFTPHLSHLCTHKLASLTVLRIVNQKIEPDASKQVVDALFCSPADHVLTDVLGDQVNGVAVIHKILTSSFIEPIDRPVCIEATKRVLIELKVIATQAYRRLIEEVGLPVPNFQPSYTPNPAPAAKPRGQTQNSYGVPGLPSGYPSNDQGLASMMASLQMGGQNPQAGPHGMRIDSNFSAPPPQARRTPSSGYMPSPTAEPFNPRQQPDMNPRSAMRRTGSGGPQSPPYPPQSPGLNGPGGMPPQMPYPGMPPQLYQQYMYQGYPQQNPPNMGTFHA
jgi:protein JSN1